MIVNVMMKRHSDNKVDMMNFITKEGRVFFVRFYEEELEMEFLDIFEMLRRRNPKYELSLACIDGTYQVTERGLPQKNEVSSWDLLMHKYYSLSKQIKKDSDTGEKYYPLRISDNHIQPCGRPIAV